ncbi:type IV toxin-antitoxin system AbiEi family antitoxin domain-containing protein [Prescottella subtropica]|uniref:type IV toxin-antitoxin system AbiEi family antitoxin domain-containing protein n=1 Tax=Prescottella subtropica TaxID=2545757 RepID=UPI0010F7D6CB|nr:hypothetical protein [Prescottella subtropica]
MTETPRLLRRSDALARGYTDAEIRTLCRTGGLRRLRPGAYLDRDTHAGLEPSQRHLELVRATLPKVSGGAVVSHQSAAALHGLPLWRIPLDRVHVTRARTSGGRRTRLLHSHCAPLTDRDVVEANGIRVTSLARTVADLCRTVPFESAIVVGDAALHTGSVHPGDLADALAYADRRPGHPAALRAFGFLDGRSESVGESRSRVALAGLEVSAPELQASLLDPDGRFLGRVDFLFDDLGVVGEFDGKVKYGKYLRDGQDPGDAVFAEKQREDRIRDAGWEVVRWVWKDLARPPVIEARIHRAMRRAAVRPRPLGETLRAS